MRNCKKNETKKKERKKNGKKNCKEGRGKKPKIQACLNSQLLEKLIIEVKKKQNKTKENNQKQVKKVICLTMKARRSKHALPVCFSLRYSRPRTRLNHLYSLYRRFRAPSTKSNLFLLATFTFITFHDPQKVLWGKQSVFM